MFQDKRRHFGQDDDDVLIIKAPTRLLNPTIPQSVVDAALAEDPAAASAEWMAEFRDDIGGYIDVALVENAVDRSVTVRAPAPTLFDYVSFCDRPAAAKIPLRHA